MELEKIEFNFPFTKVDKTKRIVKGIATANNVDQSGDEVKIEASKEAFAKWQGNIREMHGKKAVGKAISYTPVTIEKDGAVYEGIEVTSFISKGAQDTWEKILDGTLTGYSIGGEILDKSFKLSKSGGPSIRVIEKYNLGELSVVDNPCNPISSISMVKMAGDHLEHEFSKETHVLYMCEKDNLAKFDMEVCPSCDTQMTEIGYAEDTNADVVAKMLESRFEKVAENNKDLPIIEKGLQNNISDDRVETVELDNDLTGDQKISMFRKLSKVLFGDITSDETGSGDTFIIKSDTKEAVSTDKAAEEILKGESEEVDTKELLESLSTLMDDKLAKFKDEVTSAVDSKIDEKVETITKSVGEINDKVEAVATSATEAVEKVTNIETSGALKKSANADETVEEKVESEPESFWKGMFVPLEVCRALGYES